MIPFGMKQSSGVRTYRLLLVGLTGGIIMIGVIFSLVSWRVKEFRAGYLHHYNSVMIVALLVIVGMVCAVVASRLVRSLDGSSATKLVVDYRRRFFTRIALSDVPAFVSMVTVAATGRIWFYLIGATFALVGYAQVAPTARRLARDQDQLSSSGSSLSLIETLNSTPVPI